MDLLNIHSTANGIALSGEWFDLWFSYKFLILSAVTVGIVAVVRRMRG